MINMSELKNLKGKLLVEQIEEEIYGMIRRTPYHAGQKLPNEYRLSEQFGVSRSTVREAIRSLSSKGVLEVRRGSGTYIVESVLPENDPLGIKNFEDKEAIALDLVEVRLMIEPAMAEAAARNATEEEIEELKRLCEIVEEKGLRGENYIADDIAFHCYVAECSRNKVVEQLIPIIDTAVMMFVNVTHKGVMSETIRTHREVVEAIANRDPVGARNSMQMHMTYNRSMILKQIRERNSSCCSSLQ